MLSSGERFLTIRSQIESAVEKSLSALQKSGALGLEKIPEIKIEYPADPQMGDYATNVAFVLAKTEQQKPFLIAQMLAEKIMADKSTQKMFEKVEAAGAGFVNFMLSADFLLEELRHLADNYSPAHSRPPAELRPACRQAGVWAGQEHASPALKSAGEQLFAKLGKGKKLNIEFLSANPTGKFQVGNGRGAFYGDVLGNVFKLAGYKVIKEYYVNNAKSSNQIIELGKTALGMGDKYLTPYIEEKINSLKEDLLFPLIRKERGEMAGGGGSAPAPRNSLPLTKGEGEGGGHMAFAEAGFLLAQAIHKDNQKFLEKIGISYDAWTYEQEGLVDKNFIKKTLALLKKKNLVYEQDGALWLKTTQFGDDKDKVVMRSNGEHGYFLADIAYHLHKIKRGYKVIIDIFGADHQGHVNPMKIAMRILEYKGKFDILVSQLVQAKGGGKFSKRAGNVILLEELIDEIGVDIARYFYLMKSLDTQMEFDMDLAREQSEKNPVYYIQYAHTRMCSILRKAGDLRKEGVVEKLKHESEMALIKHLLRWPEVIEDTANDYQVQRVTSYAYELATVFNQFYRDCKVISEDKDLTQARLALVITAQNMLKEVLGALGISAPDKM